MITPLKSYIRNNSQKYIFFMEQFSEHLCKIYYKKLNLFYGIYHIWYIRLIIW